MLIAPRPALNQLIGVMLGMALVVGDMASTWQKQHLPILHVTASVGAEITSDATHAVDTRSVRHSDPVTCDHDLILATQASNTMTIQLLLTEGASLKARNADGHTAFIVAVTTHMDAIVCLLIQAGADVNLQNNTQNSAFLLAAGQGGAETVRLALSYGTNLCTTNADSNTAFILAACRGYVGTVNELVKADVPPDATNNPGLTTPIEVMALGDGSDKYKKTVQVLLNDGADPNLVNRGGVTPMRRARQRGFHGIGALFFKARGRRKRDHSGPFS